MHASRPQAQRGSRLAAILRDWAIPIAEMTVRLAAAALAADLLLRLSVPLEGTFLTLFHALVILAAVAFIGISILETLFYDHYRP